MDFNQKLSYLYDRQVDLKFSEGKRRMRMCSITQSYDMFDSKQFKKMKVMQELIEEYKFNYTLGMELDDERNS